MDNTFEITEAAPGVRICSYKTSRFKTGRLSFSIAIPLEKDVSAYAILPYILNRSCAEYPTYTELNKRLAELYGSTLTPSVSKSGESLVLRFAMTMIDNRFALDQEEDIFLSCAKLLFGMIFNPNAADGKFNETEVTREKRLMLERLESELNDKRIYALRRCEQIMCENEAFAANAYGTKEGIEALTPESIYNAYSKVLKTGRIGVNVVGSTSADKIIKLLNEYLSKMDRAGVNELTCQVIKSASTVRRVDEEMDVNQGKLVMGFRAGTEDTDKDYPKLKIMTDIFGGGTYSRLFMNVREKMSLCYYCSARLYRQKGIIIVQSGIENENAETAILEIQNQLNSMAEGDVDKEILKSSLLSMKDMLNSVCDTPEDIDAWAVSQITDDTFETPLELNARLESVTVEDVIEAAKAVTLDTVFMLKAAGEDT